MNYHSSIRYSSSIVTVADADRSPEDLQRWRTALPLFGYDPVQDAVEKLSKDENAKKVANQAINEVEKKVKVDLPDVDDIKKIIK